MMDVPTSSQRQPSCQQWAVQNGWSTATPPGPINNPLPSFHHLSLGSPPGQTPCYSYPQASGNYSPGDLNALSSRYNINHSMQGVQQIIPGASQGRNIPPCSLPLMNEATQPCNSLQMSLYSSHCSYQGVAPPLQLPHAYQAALNGPQSPHQNYLPVSPPLVEQCMNQSKRCSPQPGANVGSSIGFSEKLASPTSPIQQQPQWTVPTHSRGAINDFAPSSVAQDTSLSPQSPNSESRYGLDPELLPSAVKVMAEDRAEWEGKVFVSEPFSRLPPLATTSCVIEDRGNASPNAIRSTSYCVPCEGQAGLLTHLPLGALVTPLVKQNSGEKPLPLCKDTDCVVGCGSCGASMCPAMGWQDCGQRFYCPFCGKLTEVPWQHYQPTQGVEGVRVDKDKRPELSLGSYEILNSLKSQSAALLLAIDVSPSALRGGHLEFVTQHIHTMLASLKGEDGDSVSDVRVGLMTYDSRIHLFDLSPDLSRPHMLIVAETEDLQLPVREGLLVSLKDCIESINSVLQLIPQFSADCDDSSGVPMELPVKAGLAVLQGLGCPGKLLIFHTSALIETGSTNSSSGFFGTNKLKSIFQPSEQAISLARECVGQGCGVHLFVLSQQDVGGAWPGHIPYLTGGTLLTYNHLQGELDRERFSTDLKRTVEADTGYRAELRIFVSKDLRVSGCYGLFIPGPSPGHVTMATLDKRTTLAVELAHTRALDETRGAAIQVVLSYSNQLGEKRTRVHTLTLRCSRHLQDTFRNFQAQTLLAFYCKKMYCAGLERPLQELREELQTEVTRALASYRKHCCSSSVSAGQLVLPQYLRALPVYINSLRKSEVLLPGLRSSIHQRLQQHCQVLGMDVCSTATHFYPLFLPLPLSVDSADPRLSEEALRCSAASLEPRGLYLVHAPLTLLLWVGAQVPACTLVELFNTNCFSSLPSGETKLPALETPLSVSVRSLLDALNTQAHCTRKLFVVKQGDTCEEALQHHLVEDKSPNGGASYADFLYHLHVNSVRLLQ
ncbi:protein transport protein Sec24C [Leuresthes tenuis]|uniref:protein transport protein Sec24C n=1 Tax=Leuresthes tenuis TaxID=355514 RepID=UPI003B513BC5